MRVSDDRYDRDRTRFDIAVRMMHHGASTRTVCIWTGLTEDRLRKLCRTYMLRRTTSIGRKGRIRRPSRAQRFLRSSPLSFEASTLASLFYLLDLV
jgi:hypothetical protein